MDCNGSVQFDIRDAKTQFSRLLELVAQGEPVVIAKNGKPIAEVIPYQRKGIELGAGIGDSLIDKAALKADTWWKAMTEKEAEDFIEGR